MNWKLIRIIDTYIGIPVLYAVYIINKLFRHVHTVTSAHPVKNILLVKFWGIGNIFMMLPSLQALRKRYPSADIDILSLHTNNDAVETIKAFDSVFLIDTSGFIRFAGTTLSVIKALRRRDYDIIIDFEQFARFSAILCAVIGKKMTIGFNTASQRRHLLFSSPVIYDNGLHTVRSYLSLARAANAGGGDEIPAADNLPDDALLRESIGKKLNITPGKLTVVMHITTSDNFKERRWPLPYYAELAGMLIERHGAQVVITGLMEERAGTAAFTDNGVIDATGRLNFREFYELIRMSGLVISSDTAPVHIASAVEIPVVGLYGPNTPLLYGPWGSQGLACCQKLECSPCITNFNAKLHVCRHPEGKGACMAQMSPEYVYGKIKERFSNLFKTAQSESS